ncbi:MAG: class I SAM-dependent methyltransferase [Chloroflexi bacterium]|jgi:SAM-dependent methyltransferase|nr:class I SAM-dependent methyltransferase [Chloroflexota bacterium]
MTTSPDRETVAEALARLYDLDLAEDPGDLDLWLALAAREGGPLLELMAGSGRLAVPLAEAGHDVTAVDWDAAMVARARRRAEAAGPTVARRVRFVEADVRGLRLPDAGSHRLAFVPLNSILLLATRAAQAACWEALAANLAPGGLAAVDAWLPDAGDLVRYDGRLHLEYVRTDPDTGLRVAKTAAAHHDAATGTVTLTTFYDEGDAGEPPARWIRRDVVRLVGPDELRAMAAAAGLRVELVAGGYDLEPLGPHDDRAVILARKPAARSRRAPGRAG